VADFYWAPSGHPFRVELRFTTSASPSQEGSALFATDFPRHTRSRWTKKDRDRLGDRFVNESSPCVVPGELLQQLRVVGHPPAQVHHGGSAFTKGGCRASLGGGNRGECRSGQTSLLLWGFDGDPQRQGGHRGVLRHPCLPILYRVFALAAAGPGAQDHVSRPVSTWRTGDPTGPRWLRFKQAHKV